MALSECLINDNDILAEATTLDFEVAKSVDAAAEEQSTSEDSKSDSNTTADNVAGAVGKTSPLSGNKFSKSALDKNKTLNANDINNISSEFKLKDKSTGDNMSTLDTILKNTKEVLCWKPTKHTPLNLTEMAKKLDNIISIFNPSRSPSDCSLTNNVVTNVLNEIMSYSNDLEEITALANKAKSGLNINKFLNAYDAQLRSALTKELGGSVGGNCLLKSALGLLDLNNAPLSVKSDRLTLGSLDDLMCDMVNGKNPLESLSKMLGGIAYELKGAITNSLFISSNESTDISASVTALLNTKQIDKHDVTNGLRKSNMNNTNPLFALMTTAAVSKELKENHDMSQGEIEIYTKTSKRKSLSNLKNVEVNSNSPKTDYVNIMEAVLLTDSNSSDTSNLYEMGDNNYITTLAAMSLHSKTPSVTTDNNVTDSINTDETLLVLAGVNNSIPNINSIDTTNDYNKTTQELVVNYLLPNSNKPSNNIDLNSSSNKDDDISKYGQPILENIVNFNDEYHFI